MDLFENGTLVKSYRIGIGDPEFPLPEGMRMANVIIFNPTWTLTASLLIRSLPMCRSGRAD